MVVPLPFQKFDAFVGGYPEYPRRDVALVAGIRRDRGISG